MVFAGFGPNKSPISFPARDGELKYQGNFSVDIFHTDRAKLAGKPVVSALVEGANLVEEVIGLFETEFGKPV